MNKSGGLHELKDAAHGAQRMFDWATSQGITGRLITDTEEPVRPHMIYDAVNDLIEGAGLDQLFIYFGGHGVNINRNEHWLLSEAPMNTSAAVNVSGSAELARYCGVQHVVFISDACRIAPEGIQAQNVRGVDIFRNESASEKAKPVDQFFACALGRTAAEVKDPAAAGKYRALYTGALLDGIYGVVEGILETSSGEDDARYVRPRKLADYLDIEVPKRLAKLSIERRFQQNPDALILDHSNWLARIGVPNLRRGAGPKVTQTELQPRASLRTVTEEAVSFAVKGDQRELFRTLDAASPSVTGVRDLSLATERYAQSFGSDEFSSRCGIKVRGKRIDDVFAVSARCRMGHEGNVDVELAPRVKEGASLLLRFDGNVGLVVPALDGFVAGLTFEDDELVDVSYEPVRNSSRWRDFAANSHEIRALRAIAAASSQYGRFSIKERDTGEIARKMQMAKAFDPTLAIYAAYAFHDMQRGDRLAEMLYIQTSDLGVTLYDLALLNRADLVTQERFRSRVVPFMPMMSQGWALLGAKRAELHEAIAGIEGDMLNSLWSLFDANGLKKLKRAMETGEVR